MLPLVTSMAAASLSLDKAGNELIAASLQEGLTAGSADAASAGPQSTTAQLQDPRMTFEELEKLFTTLA